MKTLREIPARDEGYFDQFVGGERVIAGDYLEWPGAFFEIEAVTSKMPKDLLGYL